MLCKVPRIEARRNGGALGLDQIRYTSTFHVTGSGREINGRYGCFFAVKPALYLRFVPLGVEEVSVNVRANVRANVRTTWGEGKLVKVGRDM